MLTSLCGSLCLLTPGFVIAFTQLYLIDRDLKNWLAYNEFAYNETNNIGKLEDMFL
jgi:hypothetical protein